MNSIINERAISTVRSLREDLQIVENTRVDINSILNNLNISLRRSNLGPGVLGACKTVGLKRLIVIRPDFNYKEQERFTTAHELGHVLIHHGSHYCKNENFHMWRSTNDKENEANAFAAELLLPQRTMLNILSKRDLSISMIKSVADNFETSMSATAIRLTKLYNDPVVLIWHKNRKIRWNVHSKGCYYKVCAVPVDTSSMVSKVNKDNIFAEGFVNSLIWIDKDIDNLKCYEETIYFTNLDSYLTILKFIRDDY